jgi:hypothetical protein
MRKILVILVLMISCAAMLTLGCAGKSNGGPTAQIPSATPETSTVTASPTAMANNSTTGTVTATLVPTLSGGSNVSIFDDSLVNVSSEEDESLPEDNIPTPDAG